ncbi:PTS mannose transporter subunit IIAB [bacterium endosymbiont of Pedicinus badii]|uniref:PTS mannose transporter subunit IIAB n=1 Tax=bacterium endosymbiont of Pedicinus badii TaxID=1719126 RepID=UPI0009BB6FEA|nr:PTS mannose transporter subunit IIAB [bacterium endosymbiont of Pedicinus badii]OQM34419.1 PTS mannose transporter subunit IIAB [bacterium endosymbiont of Pedicinus badii]
MKTAIVISTHGKTAESILETAEMIAGKRENIKFVNFLSEEDTEKLYKKFKSTIKKLDCKKGVLFLVDMWGGSPFNAASRIKSEIRNCEILTGLNIPILLEVSTLEEEKFSLKELASYLQEIGKKSIQITQKKTKCKIENKQKPIKEKEKLSMNLSLIRIDDRLIHGQVVTSWTKSTKANRIIVVNDEISKDLIRKTLLTQVPPPGISAHVVSIEKFIKVYQNPKYSKDRVILLFTNPKDVFKVLEKGVKFKSVNIGGMSFKEGKKQIHSSISVSSEDIKYFLKLHKLGIELEIRKVATEKSVNLIKLIKKANNI